MVKKSMTYVDDKGERYKISYSEELQLKNLQASRKQIVWEKRNFYAKMLLICIIAILTLSVLYVFWRLDSVNFFTNVMYR